MKIITFASKCYQLNTRHHNLTFNFRSIRRKSQSLSSVPVVLGIETSCDDTGCGIVNANREILGEALCSQNEIHVRYGGVNPQIAYDLHQANIKTVVNDALRSANLKLDDMDAIAVTTKPGMSINLQVGVKYAKYLAKLHRKPLVAIHHMEAHALVGRMHNNIPYPYLVLLISGGHCLLAVVNDVDEFLLLGESLDNSPGEIMDKAARRMKLKNIPEYAKVAGGRAIELAALKAKDLDLFDFPLPLMRHRDCNFSFSGLKDSLVRKLKKKESEYGARGDQIIPEVNELCASFQKAIAEHLSHRTERGILFCEKEYLIPDSNRNILVSGGVACNDFIFKSIKVVGDRKGYNVIRPPSRLCTDNGVMIAWNGVEKIIKDFNLHSDDINVKDISPVAPLGKSLISKVIESNLQVKVTRLKNKHIL